MPVPSGVIVAWPSTIATIPTGWTRVTALDGKYIQGAVAAGDPDLTARGNATHTHTSPAHTPIQNPHSAAGSSAVHVSSEDAPAGGGTSFATQHSHDFTSALVTATNQSSTVNFNANSSNDPLFQEVIWIKSDGTPAGIPSGAYAFFDSDTLPGGWSRVQAGRFLKGAAAAGNGGATGGASTHTHVSAAHTHLQNPHDHGSFTSGPEIGATAQQPTNEGIPVLQSPHTHGLTVAAQTATNQSTTNTTDAVSHEPVFKKLNIIQNGGAADLPNSVIALWDGTNASIPAGWTRYTAMDGFFPKGAAVGEVLTTGGSATHTHTAICQPIQNSHVHLVTQTSTEPFSNVGTEILSGGVIRQTSDHSHAWTDLGTVATNQATVYNVDACTSEAAYPPYVRLIYIQNAAATPGPQMVSSYSYGFLGQDLSPRPLVPELAQRVWARNRRYR